MFMQKSVLAIISVLVLAGCVGQASNTTTVTGTGLAITSFAPDADTQFSTKTVRLLLDAENQGEATVAKDYSQIYLMGPIGASDLDWKLSNADSEPQGQSFKRDLNPANPTEERPAGTDNLRWTLTAPSIPKGQQRVDTFTARAYYNYSTEAIGAIEAYSEAESVATRNAKQTLAKSSFTVSKGPLTLDVKIIPDPVIVTSDTEVVTVDVKVTNNGGGTVYSAGAVTKTTNPPSLKPEDLNKVTLTIVGTGLTAVGACNPNQELIAGKPTSLTCDFSILKSDVSTTKSFPLKITLNYGYYVDATTQVTAVGR